jgi:hypothetical protein
MNLYVLFNSWVMGICRGMNRVGVLTLHGRSLCEMIEYPEVVCIDEEVLRVIADAPVNSEVDNGLGKMIVVDIKMKAVAGLILKHLV